MESRKAVTSAEAFYLAVGCKVDDNTFIIGSAFPVGPHLAATAGHVPEACSEEDGTLEISQDRGATFTEIPTNDIWISGQYDLAFVVVTNDIYRHIARFRAPELGETTTGFGSAYGENGVLSRGVIVRLDPEDRFIGGQTYLATNSPIGGFSGSALVGDDGRVVGLVNYGRPDQRVGGSLTGGYTGDFLKSQLEGFLRFLNGIHK